MGLLWLALAFVAGWVAKTAFHQAMTAIVVRIFASSIGKRRVLEELAKGIEKLERKP